MIGAAALLVIQALQASAERENDAASGPASAPVEGRADKPGASTQAATLSVSESDLKLSREWWNAHWTDGDGVARLAALLDQVRREAVDQQHEYWIPREKDRMEMARRDGFARAREAAAKVCDSLIGDTDGSAYSDGVSAGRDLCAIAIRALAPPEDGK